MQDVDIYKLLSYKASKQTRIKYGMNSHNVLVLSACYIYTKYINKSFTINAIIVLVGYYSPQRLKVYFDRLIECKLIALAGERGKKPVYSITQLGIDTINQINKNNEDMILTFCNKYNIVL
jgi:predicted transcriptional regulator